MAGDRARVSYDPSRKWRGLVAQQGRVTVEADWNEAAAIDSERDRMEALDVIGPAGTPDHGYGVTAVPADAAAPATPGDLTIAPGTLYLGGERLDLDGAVTYSTQPDWLDHSTDPLWVAPAVPAATGASNELVYLLASEQEVSAVEDPALADVALGGPDTMARLRILQHFVRQPTQAGTCGDAWNALVGSLAGDGLGFDAASMRVESLTTLQVSFSDAPAAPGPCQPVATGGYLGAENQMIRVMVTGGGTGTPTIVWGFDDASFLYRVQSASYDTSSGNTTVTLASAPVDSYHYPVAGQAVELLRDAAALTGTDYIASATGFVAPLAASYDPASMQLVISGQPPGDYLSAATQQLYLRVWQATTAASPGQATELGDTGVAVTLTLSSGTSFHAGDFWRFALRPIQPAIVYPARYLDAPQPPDGPRVWACPLAVLTWDGGSATATACVPPFSGLVELTGAKAGCCTVDVGLADVDDGASLQSLLTSYANQGPMTVCLDPGTYTLPEPLVLGPGFADITLQACGEGVTLQAQAEPGADFTLGLIVIQGAGQVRLRGIGFSVPPVAFSPAAGAFSGLPAANQTLLNAFSTGLQVAIGISVTSPAGLAVEDCTFSFPDPGTANVFGAGIYASGAMDGVTVTGCAFQSANPPATAPFYDLAAGNQTEPPYQLTFGYLQEAVFPQQVTDTAAQTAAAGGEEGARETAARESEPEQAKVQQAEVQQAQITPAAALGAADAASAQLLHDAVIERCLFQGVTVPVFAMTQLGTVRIDQNTVRSSYGGFWLYSVTDASQLTLIQRLAIGDPSVFQDLSGIGAAALADRIVPIVMAICPVLPATPPADGSVAPATIAVPSAADLNQARQAAGTLFAPAAGSAAGRTAAEPAAPEPAAPEPASAESAAPEAGPATAATAEAIQINLPTSIGVVLGQGTGATVSATGAVIPVADTGASVLPRLDVCDCQVDAVIAESYSGAGLLVADLSQSQSASALVHGNRIRSRFPAGEAVLGLWLAEGSVTGNIVANEAAIPAQASAALPESYSMALVASASPLGAVAVAIAGNVFIDPPVLPGQTWQVLNTVVNYSAVPAVTGISPTSGLVSGGTSVTVSGTGFTAATGVNFGSVSATAVSVVSDDEITATSPAGTGTVDVTVITAAGTSPTSAADQFTYVLPTIIATPPPTATAGNPPPTATTAEPAPTTAEPAPPTAEPAPPTPTAADPPPTPAASPAETPRSRRPARSQGGRTSRSGTSRRPKNTS
ncbi:MAG TPA: DUF6519 domain-containing protein [Streptosporangiaceae bacterium]|nr:DUF6519 domain-containing protein [Streptosporangiaceae bacterium]